MAERPQVLTVITRDGDQSEATTAEYVSVDYRHENDVFDTLALAVESAKRRTPDHPQSVWAIWATGWGGHYAMREALAVAPAVTPIG